MLAAWGVFLITLGVALTVLARRLSGRGGWAQSWFLVQVAVGVPLAGLIGLGMIMLLVTVIEGRWREVGGIEVALMIAAVAAGLLAVRAIRFRWPETEQGGTRPVPAQDACRRAA